MYSVSSASYNQQRVDMESKIEDVIHGVIILDSVAKGVIKTEDFCRLKEIRQLGCVYKIGEIYGGDGNHKRYHHCIGTYWLAKKYLNSLELNTGYKFNGFHKLCVCLAGLLHDVAHGPFSHFWDDPYIPNYKHEVESRNCIDRIFNFSQIKLHEISETHEYGVKLIKAFIEGVENPEEEFPDVDGFFFEIINNKQTGIDVDKWDYIQRDFKYCKNILKSKENQDLTAIEKDISSIDELFLTAKVSDDSKHIQYKNMHNISKLFEIREKFHKHIYCLSEVRFFDRLINEALNNDEMEFMKTGKKLKQIHSADKEAFMKLTDDNLIRHLEESENYQIKKNISCFNDKLLYEQINGNKGCNINDIPILFTVETASERLDRLLNLNYRLIYD